MEWVVAAIGIGVLVVAVRQARAKGAAASLQMAALGFLLTGAAATGIVDLFFDLLLNPIGWLGIGMLALSGVLFVSGQALEKPRKPKEVEESPQQVEGSKRQRKSTSGEKSKGTSGGDDDMSEIEDILKRHGIE